VASTAYIDFETRSECDLPKCGSDVYASDKTTDVLCMAWVINDGPVSLWKPGAPPPDALLTHVRNLDTVVGHNVGGFEILIWNQVLAPKLNWPELSVEQLHDTMAMAYAMGLPGSLDGASAACGLESRKDMQGKRVMMQLSRPRAGAALPEPTWWTEDSAPEKFKILYEYCIQDVAVERELYKRLRVLSAEEQKLWVRDWHINRRGVGIDTAAIAKAGELIEFEKRRLDSEMREVTSGAVATCSAVGQIVDWLKSNDVDVPSVAKHEVAELLDDANLPEVCRRALMLRKEAAKTSTAKLNAMTLGMVNDNRIRGLFQYHGATTGRWAGRRVQLHNLPRPSLSQENIEAALEIICSGRRTEDICQELSMFFGSALSVVSDCIRAFIKSKPGFDFIGCDFSAIEARVLSWLAGQDSKTRTFATSGKIYERAAADIYGINMEYVTKQQRMVGKVAELALGYQGGVVAFQSMAKVYGLSITDTEADRIKLAWRDTNRRIVKYWSDLESAALAAVKYPGDVYKVGPLGIKVAFKMAGSFLWCQLPSGRVICYPYPKIEAVSTPWGGLKETLTYKTSINGKWLRTKTYGGKLCENVTQATARCVLSNVMPKLELAGYPIVMHVHDECVVEVPKTFGSEIEVEQLMTDIPAWASGLPIAAEGWRAERFRK